jgi:hypothetical protein
MLRDDPPPSVAPIDLFKVELLVAILAALEELEIAAAG